MPRQRAGFCPRRRERVSDKLPGDAAGLAKTKLCRYHILGQCVKGRGCQFAHDASEIRATPDTSHAKVCRNLINTGRCDELGCPYVHNKEQLLENPVGFAASRLDQASRLCFATFARDVSSCRPVEARRQIPVADDGAPRLSLDSALPVPTMQQLQSQLSCDVAAVQAQGLQEPAPQPHSQETLVHSGQPQCSLIQAAHAVGSRWMARFASPAPSSASQPLLQPLAPPQRSWPAGCEDLVRRRAPGGESSQSAGRTKDAFAEDGTGSASEMKVVVKNTFIDVFVPEMLPVEQLRRRSSSASPRLSEPKMYG